MGMQMFIPIRKVDEARREVWGVLCEEKKDKSGEIFDYDGSKPYFKQWNNDFSKATDGKSVGNLRSMHTTIAAGKIIQMDYDDDTKKISIGAKVVDDDEWKKVEEGVYTGFSIGGSYVKRWQDEDNNATRYIASPAEASLVDNPCMYGATFEMVRSTGAVDLVKFHKEGEQKLEIIEKFKQALSGNELNKAFSFDEIRDRVSEAVNSNLPYALFDGYAYVTAVYADSLIVQVYSGNRYHLYRLAYTMSESGVVALDVQSCSEVKVEYLPIPEEGANKAAEDTLGKADEGEKPVDKVEEVEKTVETEQPVVTEPAAEVDKAVEPDAEPVAEVEKAAEVVEEEKHIGITAEAVKAFLAENTDVLEDVVKDYVGSLEKAGARNSKSDVVKIQAIHDSVCALGAKCAKDNVADGAEKAVEADDLTKVNAGTETEEDVVKAENPTEISKLIEGFSTLEKAVTDLKAENKELLSKVAKLEAQPDDSKSPVLKAVDKSIGGAVVGAADNADEAKVTALKAVLANTSDPMVKQAVSQELAMLTMKGVKGHAVMGR